LSVGGGCGADNPDAKGEPPFFLRWSKSYAWSDRARAHYHHLEVIRESGMEAAIKEEAARQAHQVELARGRFNELMAMAYERAIEYFESNHFVEQLRPADVVQIVKIQLQTMHTLGDSTDAPGGLTAVDWSEDDKISHRPRPGKGHATRRQTGSRREAASGKLPTEACSMEDRRRRHRTAQVKTFVKTIHLRMYNGRR
jgi:hypothetical protein